MAGAGGKWRILRPLVSLSWSFLLASAFVSAERSLKNEALAGRNVSRNPDESYLSTFANFLWQPNESGYEHVWPVIPSFHVQTRFSDLIWLRSFVSCNWTSKTSYYGICLIWTVLTVEVVDGWCGIVEIRWAIRWSKDIRLIILKS